MEDNAKRIEPQISIEEDAIVLSNLPGRLEEALHEALCERAKVTYRSDRGRHMVIHFPQIKEFHELMAKIEQ